MKCRHCGQDIRWYEGMGWVHGSIGDIPVERCSPDSDNVAAADPADL